MPEFTPINAPTRMKQELTDQDSADLGHVGGPVQQVKQELDEETTEGTTNGDINKSVKAKGNATATPRKRVRKPVANNDADAPEVQEDETPQKKKRTAKAKPAGEKAKKAEMRPMPTSYETASPEDRMLLRMKDVEGKGWAEIREAWETMTGDKVGGSTLSGRYARIKANLIVFSKEDEALLLRFKKEIEEKFENEKWHRVAEAIEGAGGDKYPSTAVQKKFKELQKKTSGLNAENGAGMEAS